MECHQSVGNPVIIKKLVVTLFPLVLKQTCKQCCMGFSWRMCDESIRLQPVEAPVVSSESGDDLQVSGLPKLTDLAIRV